MNTYKCTKLTTERFKGIGKSEKSNVKSVNEIEMLKDTNKRLLSLVLNKSDSPVHNNNNIINSKICF